MVKAKFTQIKSIRDSFNDLLFISVVSDLERGRLTVNVIDESGNRLPGTTFQTGIDGTREISFLPLQKISHQKFRLQLTPENEEEILDEQTFEWKGLEKTEPITFPQDLLNAQPQISIADLINKLEKSLRKVVDDKPTDELEIHRAIEKLLAGTNYENEFTKDIEAIPFSGRSYKPDFVFPKLEIALEVKFCDNKKDVKNIIKQMSDDIHPYKKRYPNVLFVVYDLDFIQNVDEFVNDFNKIENVRVIIIKN